MVKYWRSHCIKIVMFLDDGCGTNSNRHLCSADAVFVKNSLGKAGFVINWENQYGSLYKSSSGLGFFGTVNCFSLYIPDRRVDDLICKFN